MKPIDIPEDVRDRWLRFGWNLVTMKAPENQPDILSCQALVGYGPNGPQFNMLIELTTEDLIMMEQNGGRFWLTIHASGLPPFSVYPFGEDGSNEVITDEEFQQIRQKFEQNGAGDASLGQSSSEEETP